jgi:hypothetical protein
VYWNPQIFQILDAAARQRKKVGSPLGEAPISLYRWFDGKPDHNLLLSPALANDRCRRITVTRPRLRLWLQTTHIGLRFSA